MLDIGWTELLVIAVVLIVVVGPKDLPPMIRAFGKMTKRLRQTAGEFRSQFDEALREAELDDLKKSVDDIRSLNPANSLREAINPLRQMGQDIKSDLQKASRVDAPATSSPVVASSPVVSAPVAENSILPDLVAPTAPPSDLVSAAPAVAAAAPATSSPAGIDQPVTKTASRSKAKAADLEAGATEAKSPKVKPAAKAVSTPKAASKKPDAEPKAPSKVAAPGKAKPATVAATVEAAAVAAAPRKPRKTTNEDKA
jgi:sec-independent protein translocase protein TatB